MAERHPTGLLDTSVVIGLGAIAPELLPERSAISALTVAELAAGPHAASNAAERALSVGRPHATRDLADLVERIAGGAAPLLVGRVETGQPSLAMGAPA